MKSWLLVLLAIIGVVLTTAAPATACSYARPPLLSELASGTYEGRTVIGVYQQSHIDGAPNLGLRDARTVSVITRYWGAPPPNTGRVMHGSTTILGESSCGNESGREGQVGYGWVAEGTTSDFRGLSWVNLGTEARWDTTGPLTADQERLLDEAFGPRVVLDVSTATRFMAFAQLWWAPSLFAVFAGAVLYLIFSRHIRREIVIHDRFDVWAVIAGVTAVVGVSIVYITTSDLDANEFWPMLLVLATGAFGTWLSRPLGAAVSAAWLVYGIDHVLAKVDQFPIRSIAASQNRAETAIGLIVIGAGVLTWVGHHWARWPASACLVAGAALAGSAIWPVRGVIDWTLIGGTDLAATAVAVGFVVWRAGRFGTRWPWLSLATTSSGGGRGRLSPIEESPDSTGHGAG